MTCMICPKKTKATDPTHTTYLAPQYRIDCRSFDHLEMTSGSYMIIQNSKGDFSLRMNHHLQVQLNRIIQSFPSFEI